MTEPAIARRAYDGDQPTGIVGFTAMADGTADDYALLDRYERRPRRSPARPPARDARPPDRIARRLPDHAPRALAAVGDPGAARRRRRQLGRGGAAARHRRRARAVQPQRVRGVGAAAVRAGRGALGGAPPRRVPELLLRPSSRRRSQPPRPLHGSSVGAAVPAVLLRVGSELVRSRLPDPRPGVVRGRRARGVRAARRGIRRSSPPGADGSPPEGAQRRGRLGVAAPAMSTAALIATTAEAKALTKPTRRRRRSK